MHRYPFGEVAQAARVVVVEMAETQDNDLVGIDADQLERHL
jgi:hypothetical protein